MGTEHFDEKAATWDDDPGKRRQARDVARAVAAAVPVGEGTRLLEYGAGTALVTEELLASVGPVSRVTLADNSPGMRAVLREKALSGALPADTAILDLDLEDQPAPPDRFDLIVSSMVMHHVRRLPVVLSAFAELLVDGGRVCIADLDREDGTFHTHDFDGHHGFDRGELRTGLEQAGLVDVTITDCTQIERDGLTYSVFLATAVKGTD